MFAQGNHAPAATPTQSAEILYQLRRLAEHPSIAVWDGCNEVSLRTRPRPPTPNQAKKRATKKHPHTQP